MIINTLLKQMLAPSDAEKSTSERYTRVLQYTKKMPHTPLSGYDELALDFLLWPMTTFNIISYILDTNDSYQAIVSRINNTVWQSKDKNEAIDIGKIWGEYISNQTMICPVPEKLHDLFFDVFKDRRRAKPNKVAELLQDDKFMISLLKLLIASDECTKCLALNTELNGQSLEAHYYQQLNLPQKKSIKSLSQCQSSYGSVHYKKMTPQAGISLNSLSQHLAYVKPGIDCHFLYGKNRKSSELYNILILPWPLKIERDFFTIDSNPPLEMTDSHFGFFAYENKNKITAEMICYAVDKTEQETSFPDLVVIPECAIERCDIEEIRVKVSAHYSVQEKIPPLLIFGTFSASTEQSFGENSLEFIYNYNHTDEYLSETQPKHHRWALDRSQIIAYRLGTELSPGKKWWENCQIGSRKILSYHDDEIQICPLICEDLARQDPIAPVVRSLGPSLVVALLLDGPQIQGRWPERYATVLSEDPGSSVLSISPYGMTQRSTGGGHKPSSNVALWSDGETTKSLELHDDTIGISLMLEKRPLTQWSADGREGKKQSLKYAGHVCIGNQDELNNLDRKPLQVPTSPLDTQGAAAQIIRSHPQRPIMIQPLPEQDHEVEMP